MMIFHCYDENGLLFDSVYQWDKGRQVEIRGLSVWQGASIHLNFTNEDKKLMYSVPATKSGDSYIGTIPNELACIPKTITMYIYQVNTQNENLTLGSQQFWVIPRPQPSDYEYEPTSSVVAIATGLLEDGGSIYLSLDGQKYGTGANIGGGNEMIVGDATPDIDGINISVVGQATVIQEVE